MREYTNSLAATTAQYPSSVYTPRDARNRDNAIAPVTESMVIPASGLMELDHAILKSGTTTITDTTGNVVLTPRTWSTAPTTSEVSVHWDGGFLKVHADLAGNDIEVTYQPLGTVVTSGMLNRIQKEIVAAQTYAPANTSSTTFTLDADNAGAGVDQDLRYNRGSTDGDAALRWNESTDQFDLMRDIDGANLQAQLARMRMLGIELYSTETGFNTSALITYNGDTNYVTIDKPIEATSYVGSGASLSGLTASQIAADSFPAGTYVFSHGLYAATIPALRITDAGTGSGASYNGYIGGNSAITRTGSYWHVFAGSSLWHFVSSMNAQFSMGGTVTFTSSASRNIVLITNSGGTEIKASGLSAGQSLKIWTNDSNGPIQLVPNGTGAVTIGVSGTAKDLVGYGNAAVATRVAIGTTTVPGSGDELQVTGSARASGTVRAGNDTDFVTLDKTNAIRLGGTATVFEDIVVDIGNIKLGSTAPTWTQIGTSGIYTWVFDNGRDDEVQFTIQLPHSIKPGSTLKPHIHWMPMDAAGAGESAQWNFSWVGGDIGDTISTTAASSAEKTTTTSGDANLTQYKHYITAFDDVTTHTGISAVYMCRVWRDGTNDTYNGRCALLGIDFHYERDSIGSNSELSK